LAEEVDPILDKISAHGIQSLTPREREILEAARKKMTRS
jgi:DNA-binding CsgD family transcriptional regulator